MCVRGILFAHLADDGKGELGRSERGPQVADGRAKKSDP